MTDHIDALVDSLTLDEQVALLAGADFWHTVPIERAGIPVMRVSDGPVGARGTRFGGGPPSMAVPCGTALAATWDPELVQRIGEVLGREARAKGARVLLAPTVNLHRTPIGGRNFECMSEDPYLTASTAVAYVRGVQSEGVASCIKHFIGNDTEFERMSIDSRIDERTMREMYLVPFEAAVADAGVMSVMTSYNRINGPWAADSAEMVDGVLRGEWGFDGLVMSDWFGTHSTVEAITAGLDLEMPGPTRHRGQQLLDAVHSGAVDVALVRRAAGNVLRLMHRIGVFDDGEPGPETSRESAPDTALTRVAAARAMVLLTNRDRTLPLVPSALARVAVLGPNAAVGQVMGGGSAHVTPASVSHPLAALRSRLEAAGVEVVHSAGCDIYRRLPEIESRLCTPITAAYFQDPAELDEPAAQPVITGTATLQMMWVSDPIKRSDSNPQFGARLTTTFTPDISGAWSFGIESVAPGRLLIDGHTLLDNGGAAIGGSFFGMGRSELQGSIELIAGQSYRLDVEVRHHPTGMGMGGVNVGARAPMAANMMDAAVETAAGADCSIVIVGTNDDWECEGWDRTSLDLPGLQNELISRVAAVSKRTVVVVNAGSPVTMPWLDLVDAVLMVWFPGQQMGEALVDVLLGDVEPQGRLPVTFPMRLEDTPAFEHHPGRNGTARYLEGRLIGYRWYSTTGKPTLFPFGHGLGYHMLDIDGVRAVDARTVEVDISNHTDGDGVEVIQVYAHRVDRSDLPPDEPDHQLVGFTKVALAAGEHVTVTIGLDTRGFRTWDVDGHRWQPVTGPVELRVGRSSSDIVATAEVQP